MPDYKDTFEFKLFPQYTYTKLQQKRFRFFQGRIEHYRKIINYADSFDEPNTINLVYMIGYSDKVRPYVLKTKSNTVVLCADIPENIRKIHDDYVALLEKLKPSGYVNSTGEFTKAYDMHIAALLDSEGAQRWQKIVSAYKDAENICSKYFKRYIICDKMHPEKTIAHENLNWIIKRYFPRGREEQGCGDVVVRPTQVSKAALSGLRRENDSKSFGFPTDSNPSQSFDTAIKRCVMDINTEIRDKGFVNLYDVCKEMSKPPYGWGEDCHAAYCFGYALSNYVDKYYIWDGNMAFVLSEGYAQYACTNLLKISGTTNPRDPSVRRCSGRFAPLLFKEDAWRLVNRFSLMFGVKETLPFDCMITNVAKAIEVKTRIPVSIIDDELTKTLGREDGHIAMSNEDLKHLLKYFTWDKCNDIKEKYDRIDEYLLEQIKARHPNKQIHMDEIMQFCTAQCSGWLWASKMFWEQVDKCVNDSWSPYYQKIVDDYRKRRDVGDNVR